MKFLDGLHLESKPDYNKNGKAAFWKGGKEK